MGTFSVEDTLLYNLGIEFFSIIIVMIIIYTLSRDFSSSYDTFTLKKLNYAIMLVLVSDMFAWGLNGRSHPLTHFLLYAFNMSYYIGQFAAVNYWAKYAWYRLYGNTISAKKSMAFITIPFGLLSAIVVSTPITKLCFYLDSGNFYFRGILGIPIIVFVFSYLIVSALKAVVECRKPTTSDRRRELAVIAFFVVPPLIGGIIQALFYGVSTIWPAAVISSLLILLEKESREVLQDPLTKLNNRRNLERQLSIHDENQCPNILLFVFDLNDFKRINDEFGHDWGDQSLIKIADLLRETFGRTNAFIARYGGDEFVVLMPGVNEDAVNGIIDDLKNILNEFNNRQLLPFPLSLSIGYAFSSEGIDMNDLFRRADEAMYLDKENYRRIKSDPNLHSSK